jgi:hypothetical protein
MRVPVTLPGKKRKGGEMNGKEDKILEELKEIKTRLAVSKRIWTR